MIDRTLYACSGHHGPEAHRTPAVSTPSTPVVTTPAATAPSTAPAASSTTAAATAAPAAGSTARPVKARALTRSQLVLLLEILDKGKDGLLVWNSRDRRLARVTVLLDRALVAVREPYPWDVRDTRHFILTPLGAETLTQAPEPARMAAQREHLARQLRDILRELLGGKDPTDTPRRILVAVRAAQALGEGREALLALCSQRHQERNEQREAAANARRTTTAADAAAQQGKEA